MKSVILLFSLCLLLAVPARAGCGKCKADDHAEKKDAVKTQTTCPVMGGKINKELYADVNGKRIYVCCKGCIAEIKKDPDKYIKKLEDKGVTLEAVPDKNTKEKHEGHKHGLREEQKQKH